MSTLKADSIQPTNSGNNLIFKTGAGDAERMRINTSGNVGIGTNNPSLTLHVSGAAAGIRLDDTNVSDAKWALYGQTNNTTKVFRIYDVANTADRMTIDASGKLGIGYSSATTLNATLDVNGEARSSTSTTSSSNAKTLVTKDYTDNRLAFAWVVFADNTSTNPGTDGRTCTIISSKNVSSVVCKTDPGYAYYEITFTDPCVDANYFPTGQFMRRKGAASSSDAGWPLYLWPIPPYNANYGYTYLQQAPEEPSGVPSGSIVSSAESQPRPSTNKVFRCLAHRAHATGINPGSDLVRMGMVAIYR